MLQTSAVRRSVTAALALSLSVGLMACNQPTTPSVPATGVSVTLASATVAIDATVQATATVTPTTAAKTVVWSSSDNSKATVSSAGVVKGVAAGTATIKACSTVTTTVCGSATITVTPAAGTPTSAKINFQPAGVTPPDGYTADTGAAYVAATGTGWVREDSLTATLVPLDMTTNARNRTATNASNTTDARLYTQINMQCATQTSGGPCGAVNGVATNPISGAWQYKVTPGNYTITVSVGDADTSNTNSLHTLRLEGNAVITDFKSSAAAPFKPYTGTVNVADGMLTVDAVGGKNTKINYIEISPVAAN